MSGLTKQQTEALNKITHETDIVMDLIDSCKIHMTTCKTIEELENWYTSLVKYTNRLYELNKCRLLVTEYQNFLDYMLK